MNYQLAKNISWRQIEDQVLILDPRHNKKAHELNPIASFIWIELADQNDTDHILEKLCHRYENQIPKDQLKTDMDRFINLLIEQKLILNQ